MHWEKVWWMLKVLYRNEDKRTYIFKSSYLTLTETAHLNALEGLAWGCYTFLSGCSNHAWHFSWNNLHITCWRTGDFWISGSVEQQLFWLTFEGEDHFWCFRLKTWNNCSFRVTGLESLMLENCRKLLQL